MRRTAATLALVLAMTTITTGAALAQGTPPVTAKTPHLSGASATRRHVMLVGNNGNGTATVVDARTHRTIARSHDPGPRRADGRDR